MHVEEAVGVQLLIAEQRIWQRDRFCEEGLLLRKQRMEDFSYILWGDGARGGGRDKQKAREKIAEQRIWGENLC